ncbi:MAG: hypothetical protein A3A28_03925 [Candidatus Sungbacteria bacterium RIFCSPLOWO2_01_FULL_47_32]|uniref:Uncharacterized protein n=1 Tax=Candidatus Sungbacteria bacterium RIFCSPHIGHO2_01_FULL_47_32 TaxID=1802264 RepID=A0A1G2K4I4_9BACT|nr:MAG: hypothetical protein A2633_01655 [Candidatus Sungbacteria bacterium RIFCSPHIGHO2_01_FULL_47_32]OGZ99839.1 MAG: hypothetical protein A3D57_01260 [Candidatus Sungbacteria bacterium RIFCSPHIGHO2_02_FULL_46_12]OHA05056.1 MAG: hypothetical protein A3A28_03925 [Candidatus Sungbacteria bacterium RIFCSPLOWO2_01_FULL_47_32]
MAPSHATGNNRCFKISIKGGEMSFRKIFVLALLSLTILFPGAVFAGNDPQGIHFIFTVIDNKTGQDVALIGWADLSLLDSKKKAWFCEGLPDPLKDRYVYKVSVSQYLFDSDGFMLRAGQMDKGKYEFTTGANIYFLRLSKVAPFSAKEIVNISSRQGVAPFTFSAIYPTVADHFVDYGTKVPGLTIKNLICTLRTK